VADVLANIFMILIAGFFVVTIPLAMYLSPPRRLKRQLRATPRRPLRELPESTRARIVGAAQPIEGTIEAPLTGRACLYYVVTVYQERGGDLLRGKLIREERGVPFAVDDGTGRAIVDPSAAKVALDVDARSQSGTFDAPNERESAFLQRHGATGKVWIFNTRVRYREAIIGVGETVAIVGEGVREPDPTAAPEAAYRGDQPTRIRMTSSPRFPLLISDSPATTL
jgi:hypothetical protein